MPPISRVCLRLALVWFLVGLATGSWLLAALALDLATPRVWVTQHAHFLLVGFVVNLILGVAYWMFPRPHGRVPRVAAQVASVAALNIGLGLRVVAEPWLAFAPQPLARAGLLLSAVLQLAAGILFVVALWPRIMTTRGQWADVLRRVEGRSSGHPGQAADAPEGTPPRP